MELETVRNADFRQGDIVQADGASALLTEEMNVFVIIELLVVALTQLVLHATVATLNGMHQVMFPEERQGTEDTRLVKRKNGVFQFFHGYGSLRIIERLGNDDTVGSWFDAVGFKQLYIFVCGHVLLIFGQR